MQREDSVKTVGEALLELLEARGIEYFFGNSGTDFPAIIEAFAKGQAGGKKRLKPITVPHEITALAMAHGFAMLTGRPQAVMVHVIVGTANALGGIINASRAQVPVLVLAGRTALTEQGNRASRFMGIHWAQESFDQAAMLREFVKWDYELKLGSQLETVVDRALAIASDQPCGPVYLTLPAEVLAAPVEQAEFSESSRQLPSGALQPESAQLQKAAQVLAEARCPMAIARSLGRDRKAVAPLIQLAEALSMPVVENWHCHLNFPQDHPFHLGFDPSPWLGEADVILVLESDCPWFPQSSAPNPKTKVIQVAHDPLCSEIPIRSFPTDIGLAGTPRLTLAALNAALADCRLDGSVIASRGQRWQRESRSQRAVWEEKAHQSRTRIPLSMAWVSRCLGEVIDDQTIVINEYDLDPTQCCFRRPGSYFGHPPSASLGWGLGAALGAKLACPDKTVICCVGDGSYIFGVPVSAHQTAASCSLPVLFLVFNNGLWNASRRATLRHAPDGWASRMEVPPLCGLQTSFAYQEVCRAAGGYAEKVEDPEEVPAALKRALRAVREEGRQALLNLICGTGE